MSLPLYEIARVAHDWSDGDDMPPNEAWKCCLSPENTAALLNGHPYNGLRIRIVADGLILVTHLDFAPLHLDPVMPESQGEVF